MRLLWVDTITSAMGSPMYLSLGESSDSKVPGVGALTGEGHRMVEGVAQAEKLATGSAVMDRKFKSY